LFALAATSSPFGRKNRTNAEVSEGTNDVPRIITHGDSAMSQNQTNARSPSALVAIIRAAKLAGDKELEKAAKQELSERFGIKLTFANDPRPTQREVSRHA
jgi:hypothetical protein